jgi:hypothetical protein
MSLRPNLLIEDEFICAMRNDHPRVRRPSNCWGYDETTSKSASADEGMVMFTKSTAEILTA